MFSELADALEKPKHSLALYAAHDSSDFFLSAHRGRAWDIPIAMAQAWI